MNAQDAVAAIRHAVQEHGDQHTTIGRGVNLDGVEWFARLLGWGAWPSSYLGVLEKHDGVTIGGTYLYSFARSVELLTLFHGYWHTGAGYWPVASDGCGNYHALAMGERGPSGECPVVFFEMIQSPIEPIEQAAPTYADFVVQQMAEECRRAGCSRL